MAHTHEVIGKDGLIYTVVRVRNSKAERIAQHREGRGLAALRPMPGTPKVFEGKKLPIPAVMAVGLLFFVGMAGWGVAMIIGSDPDRCVPTAPVVKDVITPQAKTATEIAYAFMRETDIEKRLSYVSDPDAVRTRMADYPEQALSHPVEQLEPIGYSELEGKAVSSFSARFADGSYRMLCVIDTNEGPKVDMDSYARHCTASWQDLFTEKDQSAEVRVFVQPGDYHVGQFRNPEKWTCFLLKTPDCDQSIYGYAKAGSEVAKRMQTSVMGNESLRQHMTLKIKSLQGSGKQRLFVVEDLLAMGWVVASK